MTKVLAWVFQNIFAIGALLAIPAYFAYRRVICSRASSEGVGSVADRALWVSAVCSAAVFIILWAIQMTMEPPTTPIVPFALPFRDHSWQVLASWILAGAHFGLLFVYLSHCNRRTGGELWPLLLGIKRLKAGRQRS